MMTQRLVTFLCALAAFAPANARAQSAVFVVSLGADTVQVERVTRAGRRIEGTLILRTPTTVRISYVVTLDASGRLASHVQTVANADGSPITPAVGPAVLTVVGDSLVRESGPMDNRVVTRAAAPPATFPLGTIPVGTAFGIWELAMAPLRGKAGSDTLTVNRVQAIPGRLFVSRTLIPYSGPDSVEMDYFGQARAGFKFNAEGALVHSDWTGTTYKIHVTREPSLDVDAYARRWSAQDKAGDPFGRLSTRDTVTAAVGNATLWLEYGRPSKRGRTIWGGLVPWDRVWRFGADYATQFKTDVALNIGGARVPAGSYTLWMLPTVDRPELIVSTLVNVFGTQYNPSRDLLRVPMTRRAATTRFERLTMRIIDGTFEVAWDDAVYSVTLRPAAEHQ